ncbi:hypothetical protein ACTXKZ_11475 [Brachybacterium alimentarium]|uniref:hypothetical protein n=1 Tax=Brachybacterium alimentarium TaxID=47845 RepID=UPI003FD428C6
MLAPERDVLLEHELGRDHDHDHDQQPFTRESQPFGIRDGVVEVTIEDRDLVNGYGGATPSPSS